jgi:hypothetical protein
MEELELVGDLDSFGPDHVTSRSWTRPGSQRCPPAEGVPDPPLDRSPRLMLDVGHGVRDDCRHIGFSRIEECRTEFAEALGVTHGLAKKLTFFVTAADGREQATSAGG